MNIIHILPGLVEGGVERHVLMLSDQLEKNGHKVMVISSGGKLVKALNPKVDHWLLPVDKKNPVSAVVCALKISRKMKTEKWDLLHAHSRVPAWIAWWTSLMTGIPWLVTCHGRYSHNMGLKPYIKAYAAICVSSSVRDHLSSYLPANTCLIPNGLHEPSYTWQGPDENDTKVSFLFIGRLSKIKGIHDLMEILPAITGEWRLDVLGDGPLRSYLEERIYQLGLHDRVFLHGFRDDTDEWLKKCSCLLFPSYQEGMPLTLARAIQFRVPVIASNIPPVRELALSGYGLLEPGSKEEWKDAISKFVSNRVSLASFDISAIPTVHEMSEKVEDLYFTLTKSGI